MSPIETFPDETWDAMLSVMLSAPFHLTKRLLPAMTDQGKYIGLNVFENVMHFNLLGLAFQ